MTFKLPLGKLYKKYDLTRAQVSRRCGVSYSHLTRIENGLVNVTLHISSKILKVFGLKLKIVKEAE